MELDEGIKALKDFIKISGNEDLVIKQAFASSSLSINARTGEVKTDCSPGAMDFGGGKVGPIEHDYMTQLQRQKMLCVFNTLKPRVSNYTPDFDPDFSPSFESTAGGGSAGHCDDSAALALAFGSGAASAEETLSARAADAGDESSPSGPSKESIAEYCEKYLENRHHESHAP